MKINMSVMDKDGREEQLKNYTFDDLLEIVEVLRGENGCPWDKVQTHHSIRRNLIEEPYEAIEALDDGEMDKFADELGDILLQIVFHASLGKEEGSFSMQDVLNHICHKMISRHTHIFGNDHCDTPDEVLDNWDKIKRGEKGLESHTEELKDVCACLPALMRAEKVQKKARKVGFDFEHVADAMEKVDEELAEWKAEILAGESEKAEQELGDVLFAAVNVARLMKHDPEEALTGSTRKFIRRFEGMEQLALADGKTLDDLTFAEMDEYYNQAKKSQLR